MAANTGGASYKTGIVMASRPGFARVRFPDLDGLPSDWLPLTMRKTLKDKECITLDIGEHVACLMDEHFDDGCIIGAIYSDADTTPISSRDKWHFAFFDGGSIEYDRSTGTLSIVTTGPANLTSDGPVTVKAPEVIVDAPQSTFTGAVFVKGPLVFQAGMFGKAGAGGGPAMQIDGGAIYTKDVVAAGTSVHGHHHQDSMGGQTSDPIE